MAKSLFLFKNTGMSQGTVNGTIALSRFYVASGEVVSGSKTSTPITNLVVRNDAPGHEPHPTAALFGVLPNDQILYRDTEIAIKIEVIFSYENGFGDKFNGYQCAFAFNNGPNNSPPTMPAPLLDCATEVPLSSVLKQKAK